MRSSYSDLLRSAWSGVGTGGGRDFPDRLDLPTTPT